MSHRIVGLDIGTYSVKVLRIESSFRSQTVIGFDEELVRIGAAPSPLEQDAPGPALVDDYEAERVDTAEIEAIDEDELHRQGVHRALSELIERGLLEGDLVVVGYGLDRCLQATTQLPFTQRRQIEQVLAVQIEDRLPVDIDDLTLEFQVAPKSHTASLGEESGGPGMHRIDVVGTRTEELGAFLATLGEFDIDPRIIEVGPASLLTAYHHIGEPSVLGGAAAIVDIGHRSTDVCIVDGEAPALMRRLLLGGEDVTRGLAEALTVSWEEAEYRKMAEASLDVSEAAPMAGSPQQMAMRQVCQHHVALLADELRRTFQSHLARGGSAVDRLVLCGGGALLRGLPQHLGASLGVPVELLQVQEAISAGPGAPVRAVSALGLAARGAGQRIASRFNLRRGVFAYSGDFEFLRARARPLAVMAGLIVAALIFTLIAQKSALTARRDAYADALCSATQAVLGECIATPNEAMRRINEGTPLITVPETSAFDLFRDISSELVYLRDDIEIPVEVERMTVDIQRDVVTIRGNTDSAESVDEIVLQLDTLGCLLGVASESTTQDRATGLFDFVVRAENDCN